MSLTSQYHLSGLFESNCSCCRRLDLYKQIILAELSRAKRAPAEHHGYSTPSVHSLEVMEGNQVSPRRGEEYVINRAMYLCNLRFSWREIAQEMAWPSRRVQKLDYFRNLFSSILSIRICDRSAQFLGDC